LTDTDRGISVSLTRLDPDGRKLISIEVVDAPMHWVANLCHDARLAEAGTCSSRGQRVFCTSAESLDYDDRLHRRRAPRLDLS
jgi:hypothetical protein